MNEQMKTDLSQDLNKMLMEMYDKGFKDCEAAAMQAIDAGMPERPNKPWSLIDSGSRAIRDRLR